MKYLLSTLIFVLSGAFSLVQAQAIQAPTLGSPNWASDHLEFFDGAALLGTVTAAPFTKVVAFTTTNNGTHTYIAKATDSSGKSTTSSPMAVTVSIAATPPKITLSSSSGNVTAAGSITLSAAVTAGTGAIGKIDFYEGAILLGTKTTAPHTLTCQDHDAVYVLDNNCAPTNSPIDGISFGALPSIVIKAGTDGIYI